MARQSVNRGLGKYRHRLLGRYLLLPLRLSPLAPKHSRPEAPVAVQSRPDLGDQASADNQLWALSRIFLL